MVAQVKVDALVKAKGCYAIVECETVLESKHAEELAVKAGVIE